jgi:hypothetical protein
MFTMHILKLSPSVHSTGWEKGLYYFFWTWACRWVNWLVILLFGQNELINLAICCDMIQTWKTRPKKWYQYILDKIETIYFLLSVCYWYSFDYIINCICICEYLISDTWFLVNSILKLNIALRNFISHYLVFKYFYRFWDRTATRVKQRVGLFYLCIL